jgi:lipopolysaccharide export system protein LptC
MTDRLFAWAPVLLLVLLAALTWWLDSKVQPSSQRPDGSTRHDPDVIVEGFEATRMNPDGTRRYLLRGKRLVHYPDDNSTQLEAPQLIYFDYERSPVTVKSNVAQVAEGGDNVYFSGNVQVLRAAYEQTAELGVLTNYLHVMPDQQLAKTDQPVTLIEGNSTASAVGLEFDNKTRQLRLLSEVKARYETPRSIRIGPSRAPR